jgi:hypothetical protein
MLASTIYILFVGVLMLLPKGNTYSANDRSVA